MFLIDNPNRRYKQYTYPRRGGGYTAPQIVLHTYEAPYTRSLLAAATWLTTRTGPGSYHALAGARSTKDVLQLAPWSYETWHSVPSNNWSIGISAVAQAHMWNRIPKQARENLVKSMAYAAANAAKWLEQHHGRKVQPRLLTKAQAMRKESGFVFHATMDPDRRTDPGKDFPWSMFINEFNRLMKQHRSDGATPTPERTWLDMATEKEVEAAAERAMERVLARRPSGPEGSREHRLRYHDKNSQLLYAAVAGLELPLVRAKVDAIADALAGHELDERAIAEHVALLIEPTLAEAIGEAVAEHPGIDPDEVAHAAITALGNRLSENEEN